MQRNRNIHFKTTMIVLLIVLPVLFGVLVVTYWNVYFSHPGHQQIAISGVGTLYIPNEWSYRLCEDEDRGTADAIIYDEAGKEIFICYTYDDYVEAIQDDAMYRDYKIAPEDSAIIASGSSNAVVWYEREHVDREADIRHRYFKIFAFHNRGYVFLSTADSVTPSTVMRMVTSGAWYTDGPSGHFSNVM